MSAAQDKPHAELLEQIAWLRENHPDQYAELLTVVRAYRTGANLPVPKPTTTRKPQ